MAYKLYTPFTDPIHQWDARNLEEEIKANSKRPLFNIMLRHFSSKDGKILEAGCGFGAWCELLRRNNYDVVGLENQQRVIDDAKNIIPDIPVEFGDVSAIQYPDNFFQGYISLGVIEHFEHGPQNVLREAVRVLKPGGIALITVPANTIIRRLFTHPIRSIYFFFNSLRGRPKYFGEYRYSLLELQRFVVEAGLEVIETGVDDYSISDLRHNMGLYTDWFFLRYRGGTVWELNIIGRILMYILKALFSEYAYCCGWYVVAIKPTKNKLRHNY